MDRCQTIAKVSTLIRLGETAEECYDRAVPKVGDAATARRLTQVREDHRAHAEALRDVLAALGEEQQPRSQDFEWFAVSMVDRVGRARLPLEVLARTRQAEAAVLVQYADAAEVKLPLQAARLVRRHLARNEAHLDLIDELRATRRNRA